MIRQKKTVQQKLLLAVRGYLSFFLLMSFLLTTCLILFAEQLRETMGLTYTSENLRKAAVLTFLNVILLSALCTVLDAIRR